MASGQVGARTEGDVYQGLFFWKQAADLLRPRTLVDRVVLEHDAANGVDDVAVFYRSPGVNAGAIQVRADYFQLKYHVDNRNQYSADNLIDPAFINAKSSLLQRFLKAYKQLSTQDCVPFRLHLASNWQWKSDDKLANLVREFDGELPDKFFNGGTQSELGRVREKWRLHLHLDDAEFVAFARTLRFDLNHFGRREFKKYVQATLEAAGLRIPSANHAACPYESLTQKFLMNGPRSFDQADFRAMCQREDLLLNQSADKPRPFSIGVRSYVRFAERLESEVDEISCVASHFVGRHLKPDGSWGQSAAQLCSFLGDADRRARLRSAESIVALECHGSFALLAGWELSRNSGVRTAPLQKPTLDVWRPSPNLPTGPAWTPPQTIERAPAAADVAVCLSVTHDVRAAVETYLASPRAPAVQRVVVLSPVGGPSPQSIKGPDHAYQLAAALPALLAGARPSRHAVAHIFFACPNALMFFIGQQREALGRIALYEFDFGIERDGSYQHSFSLPLPARSDGSHQGVTP